MCTTMRLNNYTTLVRIGQQSVSHGVNMYLNFLLFKNYHNGVEYEMDGPGVLMSTWRTGYCIHKFLNLIVREDVV